MLDKAVVGELEKQMDYYVDEYRNVDRLDVEIGALSMKITALETEKSQHETLRDHAIEAVQKLAEDVPEEDEAQFQEIVARKMAGVITSMVFS